MRDTALKPRGIEDADSGVLLVGAVARAGYVNLNVQVGTQPLGRAEWLFAVLHLVDVGLKAGLATEADVVTVLAPVLGDALPAEARG